ncbi:hypothetical protein EVB84_025 [Rhizobium phage RHph_Y48]|uniref:Uncharacterized protein n=1 Tax=Rhizobium phage RHph_Y1_20 TaxID=2509571 RepID=A0A7S5UTI0_9CAUD|nr:hypothetical protein EVB57_024 [Rhizobium phage RHph_Y1_20]QIG69969.1 hypothetical protein EVB84_025 [Rhizobium phage RHph_Y48]QIG70021.1 hypothetical protein EVB85_025 [Rhizobium phage RHph_Y86]QIG70073.1 hypothetical protein EVB86_025 [Rhizobium phage RHph_Y2_7]
MTLQIPDHLLAAGSSDLPKPKGRRVSYVFTTGERLHIFGVTEQNLSGAWHRVTSADGKQYVVDPAKVNYIINEVVD